MFGIRGFYLALAGLTIFVASFPGFRFTSPWAISFHPFGAGFFNAKKFFTNIINYNFAFQFYSDNFQSSQKEINSN